MEGFERKERIGWANMKRRLLEIGDACQITSRPVEGRQITFSVPVKCDSLFISTFKPDDAPVSSGLPGPMAWHIWETAPAE